MKYFEFYRKIILISAFVLTTLLGIGISYAETSGLVPIFFFMLWIISWSSLFLLDRLHRRYMDDLLEQLRQIQKMGSLKSIIGMLPGVGSKLKDADIDDRQFVRIEAMITSMTKAERAKPSIINPSRKRRIAAGSGTKVEDVNRLLKQFDQMQKMMKQLGGKAGKGGKMNRRAMKRLANMNPEQLQSLQGGIPGVPPGLMPPKK